MQYKISVKNEQDQGRHIAIYADYPELSSSADSYGVIFRSIPITPLGNNQLVWDLEWEIQWATSNEVLAPGTFFSQSGQKHPLLDEPQDINSYKMRKTEFGFEIYDGTKKAGLPETDFELSSNGSWDQNPDTKTNICVLVGGSKCFALKAQPSTLTTFNTHPTYFICITDEKTGTVVSSSSVTIPTKVVFGDKTNLQFTLTKQNTFVQE